MRKREEEKGKGKRGEKYLSFRRSYEHTRDGLTQNVHITRDYKQRISSGYDMNFKDMYNVRHVRARMSVTIVGQTFVMKFI